MHHIDAIRSRMKVEQEHSTTKLIYSNNWNGPVLYMYCCQHSHFGACPFKVGGGRVGVLAVSFYLYY